MPFIDTRKTSKKNLSIKHKNTAPPQEEPTSKASAAHLLLWTNPLSKDLTNVQTKSKHVLSFHRERSLILLVSQSELQSLGQIDKTYIPVRYHFHKTYLRKYF